MLACLPVCFALLLPRNRRSWVIRSNLRRRREACLLLVFPLPSGVQWGRIYTARREWREVADAHEKRRERGRQLVLEQPDSCVAENEQPGTTTKTAATAMRDLRVTRRGLLWSGYRIRDASGAIHTARLLAGFDLSRRPFFPAVGSHVVRYSFSNAVQTTASIDSHFLNSIFTPRLSTPAFFASFATRSTLRRLPGPQPRVVRLRRLVDGLFAL